MRTATIRKSVVYFYEDGNLIAFIDYRDHAGSTGYANMAAKNWANGVFSKTSLLEAANEK